MSIATISRPREVHSVSPYLVCGGAPEAISFYKRAFGAEELTRLQAPDGKVVHACLRINGSTVMVSDEFPDFGMVGPARLGGSPVTIHLAVPDVDAAVARAVAAGPGRCSRSRTRRGASATARSATHSATTGRSERRCAPRRPRRSSRR